MKVALSFDDVLLTPQHSNIISRKDTDTRTYVSKFLTLKIPLISSCMDTVTGPEMAIAMYHAGGLGILHRYNTIEQQLAMFKQVCIKQEHTNNGAWPIGQYYNCAVAIGVTGDYFDRASTLIEAGANIICIDVAHGDSDLTENAVKKIKKSFSNITIIAGNVSTGEGCAILIDAGADAIRCGIGGGSLCTTRIMTGHGIPTLQSILDCNEYLYRRNYKNICVLADGGVKNSGDLVKSIAAGANAVILGQILAATDEAPGKIIETANGKFKQYRGMASYLAQSEWKPEKSNEIVPEGEETILPYKGPVGKVIYTLIGGLRSGMTYSNAKTIEELKTNAKFIQITSAGWAESKPHAKM